MLALRNWKSTLTFPECIIINEGLKNGQNESKRDNEKQWEIKLILLCKWMTAKWLGGMIKRKD